MSQLLQVRTITQVIDSRIAQFSSGVKEVPTTAATSTVHIGTKVPNKLKPLDHAPNFKHPKADSSDCRTPKVQLSPIPAPKTRSSMRSTTVTMTALRKSDAAVQREESPMLSMEKVASSTSISSFQVDEVQESHSTEHWHTLLTSVLRSLELPISKSPAYLRLRLSVRRLKRAVKAIEIKQRVFILKTEAATVIQAWVKGYKCARDYNNTRYAALTIQKYWKHVYQQRCRFLGILHACRLQYSKRSTKALKIQKVYRGFRIRKKYGPALKSRLAEAKHARFMKQQAKKIEERNRRIAAVKTIERYWMKRQQRRNLSKIRKYLWTLPYECRLLYLKFKQVKADADMLKRDVETLIATKKGQASSED